MLNYEKRGPVAYLTLDRPEADNAINKAMELELDETLSQIAEDDDIRVVVFTGAGDRAFSVGDDLQELANTTPELPAKFVLPDRKPYWRTMTSTDRVLVAAIQGKCFGKGLEIALACDMRVAAEGSEFCLPEVSRGTIPSAGGTQLLPRTIAKGPAMEMILTSRLIDAEEAYRIGLINKLVAADKLAETTQSLVDALISMAPIALKYAKEAIAKGMDLTLEQAMRLEADLSALLQTTDDRKEGIRSFLEKRPPKYQGR